MQKNRQGFTLIELAITLLVIGILAMIAAPALSNFVRSNRLTATTNDLIADLQLARTEAVKRGVNAVVCKSTDQAGCTAGGTWASGWVVFADVDNSGSWTQTASQEDVMIKVHVGLHPDTAITASAGTIVFSRHGLLTNDANGAGDYRVCESKLNKSRTISLNGLGRTTLSEGSCS